MEPGSNPHQPGLPSLKAPREPDNPAPIYHTDLVLQEIRATRAVRIDDEVGLTVMLDLPRAHAWRIEKATYSVSPTTESS